MQKPLPCARRPAALPATTQSLQGFPVAGHIHAIADRDLSE